MQRPREGEIREHVNAVAFHPTKPFIAFGCNTVVFRATSNASSGGGPDGARPTSTIKIWSIVDQKFSCQWALVGSIQAMTFSPDDGKLLAVATHTDGAFNSDHESIERITLFNSQDGYRFVKHDSDDSDHHHSSRVVSIAFCPPPNHPRLMNTVWKPLADATQHMAAQLVTPRADGILPPQAMAAAQQVAAYNNPAFSLQRQDSSMPLPPPGLTINPSMSNGEDSKYSSAPLDTPTPPSNGARNAEEAAMIATKAAAIRNGIENDRREVSLIAALDYRGQIRLWNFRSDRQWPIRDTTLPEADEPEFNGKIMFSGDGLALFVLGLFRLTGFSVDHKPEAVEIKDERKKKFEDARARRKKKALKKKMEEEKAKKAKAEKAGKVVGKSDFNRAKSLAPKYEKCTKFLDLRVESLSLKKMYTFTSSTTIQMSNDDIAALAAANPGAAASVMALTPIPGASSSSSSSRDRDEKKPTYADGGQPDETLEGFEPVAAMAHTGGGVRFDVPPSRDEDEEQYGDSSDDELPVVAAFKIRAKDKDRERKRNDRSRVGSVASRSSLISVGGGSTTPMVVETMSADQWIDPPTTRVSQGSIGSADEFTGGSIAMRGRTGSMASIKGGEVKQRQYGLQRALGAEVATAVHIKASGLNMDMQEYRILLAGQEPAERRPKGDASRRDVDIQSALRYIRVRVNHYRIHRKNPEDAKRPEYFDLAKAGWCDWSLLCSEDRQWGVIQHMDMPPTGGYALAVTRVDPAWGAQQVEHDTSKLLYRIVNWSLTDTNMISTIVGQHDYPVHDVRICPMAARDILQAKGVVEEGESVVASASEDESVRLWSFTLQPAGEEDDPGDPVAKFVVERPRIDIRTGLPTGNTPSQIAKHERLFHTPATTHSIGARISRPVTITSAVAPPTNVPQFLSLLTSTQSSSSSSTSSSFTSASTMNGNVNGAKFTSNTTATAATVKAKKDRDTHTAATSSSSSAANTVSMAMLPLDHDQTPLDGFEGTAKSSHKSTARDSCRRGCWWMN